MQSKTFGFWQNNFLRKMLDMFLSCLTSSEYKNNFKTSLNLFCQAIFQIRIGMPLQGQLFAAHMYHIDNFSSIPYLLNI